MRLKLIRPLAFFDLETTGKLVATAEIVEICIIKIHPNRRREMYHTLVKPKYPIPEAASDVHHITDDMVKDAPTIEEIIDEIYQFLDGADIAGYNSNKYDVPLLARVMEESNFQWPSTEALLVDACNIYKRREGRTLKDANLFYTGEVLEDAHSAEADVIATINVLFSQLDVYPDLPDSVEELAIYSNYDKKPRLDRDGKFDYDDEGYPIITFGKKCIGERCNINHSYLDWIISSDSFSTNTKAVAKRIKKGEFDPKPQTTSSVAA